MSTAGRSGYHLPVLTYHSIDDSGSVVSTSLATFRRQMEFLSSHSFRAMSLSALVSLLRNKSPLPAKHVCLTFDDGYENVYSDAFPIVQEHGFTATVFLVTRYCGRHNDWPGNLKSLTRAPLLSWNQVREMAQSGIEFGSHTLTHPDLTRIKLDLAQEEILRSKQEIEDRTGRPPTLFAYPYGRYNVRIQEMVRSHFQGACSAKLGNVRPEADPYTIRRIDSWFVSHATLFTRLTTTSLAWYLQARQAVRELKNIR
jgi:peptidoglycan/xylan/chitin deacetylase (PgdA/CDA1 family)